MKVSKKHQYICQIGEEDILESAADPTEAASQALDWLMKENSRSSLPAMIKVVDFEDAENIFYVYTPLCLSNLGKHKQSAKLISLINQKFSYGH